MKKRCSTLLLVCLLQYSFGQIRLDKNDLLQPNKAYKVNAVPDSAWHLLGKFNPGDSGANARYDMRFLDSIPTRTFKVVVQNPAKHGFAKSFDNANGMLFKKGDYVISRDPVDIGIDDFPKANDTFFYQQINTDDSYWEFTARFVDHDRHGEYQLYNLSRSDLYSSDSATEIYLRIEDTPWPGLFSDADCARLSYNNYDKDENLRYRIFDFYKTINGNFVRIGVGAEVDKGLLAIGSPGGTYKRITHRFSNPQVIRRSGLKIGDRNADTFSWNTTVTEGFTTLKHYEYTLDTSEVTGNGILKMGHDSFQVYQVRRYKKHYRIDSVSSIFGNQVLADSSIVFSYAFYAKQYGLPVAVFETDSSGREILEAKYISTMNREAFKPAIVDTFIKWYDFLEITDDQVNIVGQTILIDTSAIGYGSGVSGVYDTLNSPFKVFQPYQATNFAMGLNDIDSLNYDFHYVGLHDSVWVEATRYFNINVDGFGTLFMQNDSTEALRVWMRTAERWNEEYHRDGRVRHYQDFTENLELWYLAKNAQYPLVRVMFYDGDPTGIKRIEFMKLPWRVNIAENYESSGDCRLYPNPTSGKVSVSQTNVNSAFSINVYDVSGQQVFSSRLATKADFDLSFLQPGIYVVKILNENKQFVENEKLIIH